MHTHSLGANQALPCSQCQGALQSGCSSETELKVLLLPDQFFRDSNILCPREPRGGVRPRELCFLMKKRVASKWQLACLAPEP